MLCFTKILNESLIIVLKLLSLKYCYFLEFYIVIFNGTNFFVSRYTFQPNFSAEHQILTKFENISQECQKINFHDLF